MKIRDRIIELKRVKAKELSPHPSNWRTHPQKQQDAMRGALAEIGYADALKVRQHNGGYQIIDGHLRAETTPDMEVPVLVLDLDDTETKKMLATFDPLAGLAEIDDEMLKSLSNDIDFDNEDLKDLADELTVLSLNADGQEFTAAVADDVAMTQCPECGHEFPK